MNDARALPGWRGSRARFGWLWGGILLFLVVANRDLYFARAMHETKDGAVNALQIDRAKQGREILGNYSRFHFHHPGPAFFYAYAAGEIVLYDWLRVVPSPNSAHALTGVALQSFFFAAALTIAAGWIRRPLFLPVFLALVAGHLALAGDAFTSIWPPHVLLMPFLCFLVAGASLAAGRVRHLPVVVLSGCFLAHGHVAQPLFVVTLFALAYGGWWLSPRIAPASTAAAARRRQLRAHLLALVVLAVFLIPLAIDLTRGSASNVNDVLEFLRVHPGPQKSWWKSLLYLVSFPAYLPDPENYLLVHGPANAAFLRERLGYLLAWLVPLAAAAGYVVATVRARRAPARAFALWLTLLAAVAAGLCVYWGTRQVGPMFAFNGYFSHALLCVPLLLAAAGAAAACRTAAAPLVALLIAGAATLTLVGRGVPETSKGAPPELVGNVRQALADDGHGDAPRLLVFEQPEWETAASVALAIERAGLSFAVEPAWEFMFTPDHTWREPLDTADLSRPAVWRLVRGDAGAAGRPLLGDVHVCFEPFALDPASTTLDAATLAARYAVSGLSTPEADGAWTSAEDMVLRFRSPPASGEVVLTIAATPYGPRGGDARQPMQLFVNGEWVGDSVLTESAEVSLRIPSQIWNRRSDPALRWHFPAAKSPRALRESDDTRMLAWKIRAVRFHVAK